MLYRVHGVSRVSGKETSITVEAESQRAAEKLAQKTLVVAEVQEEAVAGDDRLSGKAIAAMIGIPIVALVIALSFVLSRGGKSDPPIDPTPAQAKLPNVSAIPAEIPPAAQRVNASAPSTTTATLPPTVAVAPVVADPPGRLCPYPRPRVRSRRQRS
jgi:hypothetical protein